VELIANPEGPASVKVRRLASRLSADLANHRIALISNQKPGGTSLLEGVGSVLARDHQILVKFSTKPSASKPHPDLLSVRAMGEAAVLALGD
jgi:hypothetical protein